MTSKRKEVRFVEDMAPSDKALLRMSKRRRDDTGTTSDALDDSAYLEIGRKLEPRPGEKKDVDQSKHTLDSDEEEDEKYERLNMDNVEGQEEATLEFDEETKITPFNMAEEMEEGHFDTDGTFIFNKKAEPIRDAWLDNIDWAKIKKDAGGKWQGEDEDASNENSMDQSTKFDRTGIYEQILQFLQPKETITKALQRLGGSRKTSDVRQARWKEKKNAPKPTKVNDEEVKTVETTEKPTTYEPVPLDESANAVTKLTELVDALVGEGEFEIYGYTYEKINHEVEKLKKERSVKEKKPVNYDSALDMFADEIDESKLNQKPESGAKPENASTQETSASDDVRWEFKWKNEDGAEIFGPYGSQQMQQWTDDGYFKDGVWVRRIGQSDALFYNSKRIDFELYI